MTTRRTLLYPALLPCAWILLQSCGGSSEADKLDDPSGGGAGAPAEAGLGGAAQGGTSNGGAAQGGTSNGGAAQGGSSSGGATNGGAAGAGGSACSGKVQPAIPAVVDVHLLLDATASMTDTANGPAGWPALTAALVKAINDSKNAGMGMGLTFMPNPPPAGFKVPGSCASDADCTTGTCQTLSGLSVKACSPGCSVDSDCGFYGPCLSFLSQKLCNGAVSPMVSCDPADYTQPAVEIGLLPGSQTALSNAIVGKTADGESTPTLPALEGALAHASTWAGAHPGHLVQVLLATDGLPVSCTGNSIDASAQAAATAYASIPSVATFVLSVNNESKDLDFVAKAGGTQQAAKAWSSTLDAVVPVVFDSIRARGACSFQLPAPEPGQSLDLNLVNLTLTDPVTSAKSILPMVFSEQGCDPVSGGWYYDPVGTATPTLIKVCPATCTRIHAGSKAETVIGC